MSQQLRATQFRIDKFETTSSGTLRVKGKLTKVGVFEYMRGDDRIRELRSDKEVFDPASLDTLIGAHVTVDHPQDFVGSDNWRTHSVGTVIRADADPPYVVGELAIYDATAKHQIEHGYLKEISCGYYCTPQRLDGADADVAQTEIRYNHAALGPSGWGRLGSDVGLTLDSAGNQELPAFMVDMGQLTNGDISMSDENEVREDSQEALPLDEKRDNGIEAKLDKVLDVLTKHFEEPKAKKQDRRKNEERLSNEDIIKAVDSGVGYKLGLELRARSAHFTVFESRQDAWEDTAQSAELLCKEVLGVGDDHGLELAELVSRAEIKADTIRGIKAEERAREDRAKMLVALGRPMKDEPRDLRSRIFKG